MITLLASVCYAEKPVFVPPAERALPLSERPWQKNTFVVIAYHDVEAESADQRYLSVRSSALSEQLAWLKDNRYNVVSVDQILAAHNGGTPLPNKAVLLTFDDGYSSFYNRVYPFLEANNLSAVLAPVGTWIDTPPNKKSGFWWFKYRQRSFSHLETDH
uniref:NodB homology domain-containing protein n=1 Tax=Yersinia enterocolitica W22703 TaxID=913028 RepID=F4N0N7_YEREN|nr:hypothetical protein YEW_LQ49730 [Yersinia enterocolitica W22703]